MKQLRNYLSMAFLACLILTGCGGKGGGDGEAAVSDSGGISYNGITTQAHITSANAASIFSIVYDGFPGLASSTTSSARSFQPFSAPVNNMILFDRHHVNHSILQSTRQVKRAKAVSVNDTYNGSVSGTLTVTGDIVSDTGTGVLTETYVNYNNGDGTTHDAVIVWKIDGYDKQMRMITDATLSFTSWTIKATGYDVTFSGSWKIQKNVQYKNMWQTYNFTARDNSTMDTFRFENFLLVSTYDNFINPYYVTLTIKGRTYVARYGYVDTQTDFPLTYVFSNDHPHGGGPIKIMGTESNTVITPISEIYFRMEIDENGDGAFESKKAYAWSKITGDPVDVPPAANAGPDQIVVQGTVVTLNGSASSDPFGNPLTYSWSMTAKPAGSAAVLSGASSATVTFTADIPGVYNIGLTVNNGKMNSSPDVAAILATAMPLDSIAVTPSNTNVVEGRDRQFKATGIYSDKTTLDLTEKVTWKSSDPSKATITMFGMAMGRAVGSVTITAEMDGISGSTTLTVTPVLLETITINPLNPVIVKGTTQQFNATGIYNNVTAGPITSSATWSSSNPSVAIFSNTSGSHGVVTPISAGSTTITASLDGITGTSVVTVANWTLQTMGFASIGSNLYSVASSSSLIVAVGDNAGIYTSSSGTIWTKRPTNIPDNGIPSLQAAAWCGTKFFIVGSPGGTNNNAAILSSPDGITWTSHDSGVFTYLYGVACSGTQVVAVGGSGTILTSPDGNTWAQRDAGTPFALYTGIIWTGSQFIIVSNPILSSSDGITWKQWPGIPIYMSSVVWTGTQFNAVGSGFYMSSDGISWTQQSSDYANSIAWSGTQLVAVGGVSLKSAAYTSPDGATWSSYAFGPSSILNAVVWTGSQFVAVGSYGSILTSP